MSNLSVVLPEPSKILLNFSSKSLHRTFYKIDDQILGFKVKKLSIEEKASILAYSDAGMSTKQIIIKTKKSKNQKNETDLNF